MDQSGLLKLFGPSNFWFQDLPNLQTVQFDIWPFTFSRWDRPALAPWIVHFDQRPSTLDFRLDPPHKPGSVFWQQLISFLHDPVRPRRGPGRGRPRTSRMRSVTGMRTSKGHDFREFWTRTSCGGLSTYTCIKALKCRRQPLFLMQIQNLMFDFRGFDFLLFLGIKSESNHWSMLSKTNPFLATRIWPNEWI